MRSGQSRDPTLSPVRRERVGTKDDTLMQSADHLTAFYTIL